MDRQSKRCAKCSGYGRKRHPTADGYIRVYEPAHPEANADGYVLEHRKVVSDAGIEIPHGHHVHHINGDKQDNRLENLEVLSARAHLRLHAAEGGKVINQYGVWPVLTPQEKREKQRVRLKRWREANKRHIQEYRRRYEAGQRAKKSGARHV